MKKAYLFILLLCSSVCSFGQSIYQPYSFSFYQKLQTSIYNNRTSIHSTLKPYLLQDSLFLKQADSVLALGVDTLRKGWVFRKLFNEHLIQLEGNNYTVYADFLPDLQIGRDFSSGQTTWLNTRGYQIGGSIGKKFSFYTSGYENQGRFAPYYNNYVDQHKVVPGQSLNRNSDFIEVPLTKDWSYVTALLSYTPNKYLNIALGYDKNFIGDGYRSLLLSDFSSPYSYLKLTGTLGNVSYMAMWTGMQDPSAKKITDFSGNRTKGAAFHYLDWNVNNRLSVGFFDAVVWTRTDDQGNRRSFNVDYLNPIIFLRPLEASSGSPDNALIGFTTKYEVLSNAVLYGQFVLDDFVAKNFFSNPGFYRNKYGFQLGVRGSGLLNIKNLTYLLEYNSVRPFTYSEKNQSIINYANYNEPLAHPFGANFREVIGMLSYTLGRFTFSTQLNYARYGYDINGINYGKDIFKLYEVDSRENGNYIGQGLKTNFWYSENRLSCLINPKYNLRLEIGGIHRTEKNEIWNDKVNWLTFGLRSSFRNLYSDF